MTVSQTNIQHSRSPSREVPHFMLSNLILFGMIWGLAGTYYDIESADSSIEWLLIQFPLAH